MFVMDILAIAAVAFTAAGFVKGVVGFGFPVITLIILAVMLLLHAKWPDVYFDPLFDKLLPDK